MISKFEIPSKIIELFMGDFDLGLYMCMVNEGKDYMPSTDGDIELSSDLDDTTKEMKPINGIFENGNCFIAKEMEQINGIFGLENCFITKDGEIYQRVPTKKNKDGIETITRNFSTYKVQDIADKAFGLCGSITPIKHNY